MKTLEERFEEWWADDDSPIFQTKQGPMRAAFLAGAAAREAEILEIILTCADAIADIGGDTNLTRFGRRVCDEIARRIRQQAEGREESR